MSARSEPALAAAVAPVIGRMRRARALRGVSAGAAIGAALATATGALPWLGLAGLGAFVGLLWPLDPRDAVTRLDRAAGLDGALRCAWDHKDDAGPMSRAQQNQALAALEARRGVRGEPAPDVQAAPMPAPAWLLGAAAVILPFIFGPAAVAPTPAVTGGAQSATAAQSPAAADPRPTVSPSAPAEAPAERDPRATADEPESQNEPDGAVARAPDAGRGSADGGVGGAVRAEGVAGRAVGESGGGRAGARPVEARAGLGPALILPAATGDRAPGDGPAGRLVVGRTPPPPDAIADPARPYPSRYRRAIAAWFDRSRP